MKKILVFLDIDGTLIKPDQRPNTKKLPNLIQELSEREVLFGLNSNRSLEDITPIYQQFALNGPIILENGVYFLKSLNSQRIFLTKDPLLIRKISVQAVKSFIKRENLSCEFHHTDTVKIIKSKRLKSIPLGIFVNGFRKYTGSVHIFRYGERDFKLAKKLCSFLRKYFTDRDLNLAVEVPKTFGNVIFWPRDASKGKALRKIKKFYPEYDFFMIGDDLADLETRKEIESFFAVANAQNEVKKAAHFTASEPYTKGVIEILNYIEENSLKTIKN